IAEFERRPLRHPFLYHHIKWFADRESILKTRDQPNSMQGYPQNHKF
ncbi:10587_t:CDS:1, partial [Ambispora leptoticha]